MLRYADTYIVFQEIPDETTLAINLANCPCRCPGCHSPHLWADKGQVLDAPELDRLIRLNAPAITCVAFMGGDAEPEAVDALARHVREAHPRLKTAWYSGRTTVSPAVDTAHFDYIKIGPYLCHLGPLDNPHTNQRLYRVTPEQPWQDLTPTFWKGKTRG